MRGTSLRQIIKIADELSLSPRALRVDLDQLHKLTTPAILHWDLADALGHGGCTAACPLTANSSLIQAA